MHPEPKATDDAALVKAPNGGFRAWLHVALCHTVFLNTWGLANSYGVFQQYYTHTLDRSQSDISWIGGIQMFLLLFVGAFSGRATDAGYFRHCFVAGAVLQALGFCMASLSTTYYQILLSQAVCVGLGSGLVFTPGLSVMGSYFTEKRSVAVGLAASGAATGGILYPATANALLHHPGIGYGWTMRILALILLVIHVPSIIAYRPYLPPRSTGPLLEWRALRERPFVFFTASMFLNFSGLYMAFYYLGTFAREQIHLQTRESTNLLIILNAVGILGRSAPGFLAERYTGVCNMTLSVSLVCAICIYAWAAIDEGDDHVASLYTWTVVYGIFAGAAQALFPAMATRQTTDRTKVGARTGMVMTIVSFACLTAPAIQGALMRADGGRYLGAQVFSGSVVLMGVASLGVCRWCKVGFSVVKV
ncbi:major facilitator superfamily domain-containing protein [Aspergillus lucknowensis]|uniref:Major facilitator superfamily domain-containing protein n=1 Tax=Aspergillus lucknowensis TaxID=176173 RepID=A0ABR4LVY8_9EURO